MEEQAPRVDLTEHEVRCEVAYRGSFLTVRRDEVRLPDGKHVPREYILHPGAVAVVALTEDGRIVMERQHRYPLRQDFIEIPAGKREAGEAALDTARRELLEETGFRAERWERIGVIHNAIAYSDEAIEIFRATGLIEGRADLDQEEFLEVLLVPIAEVKAMACDGRITDAKTLSALLLAGL